MRNQMLAGAVLLLAACGGEAPVANNTAEPAAAASLQPGEYELTTTVASFRKTDTGTPSVQVNQGETATSRACVGADGAPPPELFAAKGDQCRAQNPYVRNGRLNMTLDCSRTQGKVMAEVSGTFTADSLSGQVNTSTYFYGDGDYALVQDFTGRRVGECSAASGAQPA